MAFLEGPPIDVSWLRQRDWWANVDRSRPDACWPWVKSTASHGYGQTWDGITVRLAHRVAWTLANGAIPEEMTIDHVCRNRRCCNVDHMRLLSNINNARLNGNAIKTHCKWGHPFDGVNTHVNRLGHRCCRACQETRNARRYRAA